jgi:hypothetical protein
MPLLGPLVSMSAKVALEKIASKNPIEAPTPDFLCLYSTSMVDLIVIKCEHSRAVTVSTALKRGCWSGFSAVLVGHKC